MGKAKDKYELFAYEYIANGRNASQAAIAAGYKPNNPGITGHRLLKKPKVQAILKKVKQEAMERNKISIDECLDVLAKMARVDIAEYYNEDGGLKNIHDISEDARLALDGIDVDEIMFMGENIGTTKKIKISSRRGNIVEILKVLGGYKEDNAQKAAENVVIFQIPDNGRG